MAILPNISAAGTVASTVGNQLGVGAAGSLGNAALSNTAGNGATGGQISTADMSTLMSGLNGALGGESAMTNALDEFEKQDKMIQQMGKAKKSAVDDAAIL